MELYGGAADLEGPRRLHVLHLQPQPDPARPQRRREVDLLTDGREPMEAKLWKEATSIPPMSGVRRTFPLASTILRASWMDSREMSSFFGS